LTRTVWFAIDSWVSDRETSDSLEIGLCGSQPLGDIALLATPWISLPCDEVPLRRYSTTLVISTHTPPRRVATADAAVIAETTAMTAKAILSQPSQVGIRPPRSMAMPYPSASNGGPGVLHDGQLVRFRNEVFLVHSFVFAQMRSLADARKPEALARKGLPATAQARRHATGVKEQFCPLSPGALEQVVVDEPPRAST
jgi:hypothetical protein